MFLDWYHHHNNTIDRKLKLIIKDCFFFATYHHHKKNDYFARNILFNENSNESVLFMNFFVVVVYLFIHTLVVAVIVHSFYMKHTHIWMIWPTKTFNDFFFRNWKKWPWTMSMIWSSDVQICWWNNWMMIWMPMNSGYRTKSMSQWFL